MPRIEDTGGGKAARRRPRKSGQTVRATKAVSRSRGGASSASGGSKRGRGTTSGSTTSGGARGVSAGASVWPQVAPHAGAPGTPALELVVETNAADAGLLDVLLELLGTERLTLGHALAAWQREQDRLANRAWRRPGGLARPAGL